MRERFWAFVEAYRQVAPVVITLPIFYATIILGIWAPSGQLIPNSVIEQVYGLLRITVVLSLLLFVAQYLITRRRDNALKQITIFIARYNGLKVQAIQADTEETRTTVQKNWATLESVVIRLLNQYDANLIYVFKDQSKFLTLTYHAPQENQQIINTIELRLQKLHEILSLIRP